MGNVKMSIEFQDFSKEFSVDGIVGIAFDYKENQSENNVLIMGKIGPEQVIGQLSELVANMSEQVMKDDRQRERFSEALAKAALSGQDGIDDKDDCDCLICQLRRSLAEQLEKQQQGGDQK